MSASPMKFDTKIAIVVRDDLPVWQKLNMTAFLASGIASNAEVIGAGYVDGGGRRYRPMFRQPVMMLAGSAADLRAAYDRAQSRGLAMAIFTDPLFATGHESQPRRPRRHRARADVDRRLLRARPQERRRPRVEGADAASLSGSRRRA
jgi:hypothetical protein